jgi:4-diphosphocytidyl-2-C-methyl-D-erythritol kinase
VADAIVEAAPAKLNLDLHVLGRRADGYHELDSTVVFTALADRLEARPAASVSLAVEGPFAGAVPPGPDNLVLRAAAALRAAGGVATGAALRLTKAIPVAAGLGGGSADAAAALRALRRLWRPDLDDPTIRRIALGLGADVPACLIARPLRLGGVGERLAPFAGMASHAVVLVNPGIALATRAVFAERRAHEGGPRVAADWRHGRNDLEPAAIRLAPAVGEVLTALRRRPGCRLARMSGSGATCFGLFDDPAAAEASAAALAADRPHWWIRATTTGGSA